jgi:hypothetical protein
LTDLVGGLDTIHFRHNNVEHDDIRVNFTNSIKGYLAIFSLVDFPVRLLRKKRTQGVANELVIVYHKDGGCFHNVASGQGGVGGCDRVLSRLRYVHACVFTIRHILYSTDEKQEILKFILYMDKILI